MGSRFAIVMIMIIILCSGCSNGNAGEDAARELQIVEETQQVELAQREAFVEPEIEEKPEPEQADLKKEVEEEESKGMEEELLATMQETAQYVVEDHIYTDMDHDGTKEMVGAYRDEKGRWEVGYCSSDGQACAPVPLDMKGVGHDCCTLEAMDLGEETHIVFNCWNLMGTEKRYAILALRNQEIVCLVPFQYGYVWMTDAGDILLDVEDYDSMFDPNDLDDDSDGIMLGHTWKDTYLFFEDGVYKEYGATKITEEMFLTYQNAQTIKDQIEEKLREENTVSMEYSYFRRSNGIMHIQCNVKNEFGGISYGYYTVRFEGNVLEKDLGVYNSGQMYSFFSNFEKVY